MASTPTTKSQVQAYRFVLRRMESALVRKDAVMLHDPMGTHKRATVGGIVLACIGLIGFLVWGLFAGKGTVPNPGSIVIGKETGSVYVVTADERAQKRLIPMFNMASARLLVMAQGGGQGGQPVQPTTVKESALAEFPRGLRTGMINAPVYLPDAKNPAPSAWAICDVGEVQSHLTDSKIEGATKISTTVIGGDEHHGTPLPPDRSLYVRDQSSGKHFLVYVPKEVPGQKNTKIVKAPVDPSQRVIMDLYGLSTATPRAISTNMLNAIPQAPPLVVPSPQGDRAPINYMGNGRYQVGDVVRRTVPGEPFQYFVLLRSGKQEISRGAAAVLHASHSRSGDIPNATGEVTEAPNATGEHLPVDTLPLEVPRPMTFQESSTSCLSWKHVNGEQQITATVDKRSPARKPAVELARSDGPGPRVDFFYMPAGKSAVIRGTTNESAAGSGPIHLVSDQGVVYGIKDQATAQGLGVISGGNGIKPGPAWITRVLPPGAFLDPAQASWAYDSVPVPGGGVNRPPPKQGQS